MCADYKSGKPPHPGWQRTQGSANDATSVVVIAVEIEGNWHGFNVNDDWWNDWFIHNKTPRINYHTFISVSNQTKSRPECESTRGGGIIT